MVIAQLSQMGAALLAGCFGGALFSLYQHLVFDRKKKRRKLSEYLLRDGIFCAVLILLWLVFWFCCTDGSLRLSVFLWLMVGFSIYMSLFRPHLAPLWEKFPRRKKASSSARQKHKKKDNTERILNKQALLYLGFRRNVAACWGRQKAKLKAKLPRRREKEEENIEK